MEKKIHPAINSLKNDFEKGTLSRREFIRYATLLGVSAATATQMAGISLFPKSANATAIKRGGTIRIAGPVQKITHPAQFAWVTPSNQLRHVAEYLTITDHNNVTHPHLLENWQVSDDLKTWVLNLRKGVTFNNGDEFVADDVVFTFQQWFDESVGSSMKGMLSAYLSSDGIEKTGTHQVTLHLNTPEIGVPEHLFHYPALILNHRTFEGDFKKAPHGTGPYTLERYVEGESCVLKRRNDYWKTGADGEKLPYIDTIEYVNMGTEMAPMIAAIKAGEIDMIDFGDIVPTQAYHSLKDDPNMKILPVTTNITRVLRMRVDKKPWDDNRVRMALKLCQNREKTLALAYFGEGAEGQDTHVSPKHPEYAPVKTPGYNPEKAKQLLKEAGYPNGLDVTLAVGSGWPEVVRYAEIIKQDAKAAGLRITLKTMPVSQYWEQWTEVDFGITPWTHRPLGTMVLNLAYTADKDGKPVPWNETRWVDKEFSALLTQANGTLDIEKRRKIFAKLEKIQMERGSIANAFWLNYWSITRKHVENVKAHPSAYLKADEMWLNS
jgi:peptide/nickel transport system substrate-binding protein